MAETGVVPFGRLPPDCATVDFFDVGDCAPGAVDHHDFERPVYVDGTIIFLNLVHHNKNQTPNALTPNTLTPNTHHPTPHTAHPNTPQLHRLHAVEPSDMHGPDHQNPNRGRFRR